MLKNLPFYTSGIKKSKNKKTNFTNARFLSELPFFPKKVKDLINHQLSKELTFFPRKSKKPKRLTKHHILKNILQFYDSVGISRKQHAFRNYEETDEAEVVDRINLSDSLFLEKSSITDLFLDSLKEKRSFKYILSVKVTLKRWNNETNTYGIDTSFRNSDTIAVTNQRFDLNKSYETLKDGLSIYSSKGSGWIIDKIENIWINISNYDPLLGSTYIPLPSKLNNPKKCLNNIKNKDIECFKWCHIRFLDLTNSHPERKNKQDKKLHLL